MIIKQKRNKKICLFINVSDISFKLFNGTKLKRNYKVIKYNSEDNCKSILEYVDRLCVSIIVLETTNLNHLPTKITNDIIKARLLGIVVYDANEFYGIVNRRIPLVKLETNEYLADDIFSIGLKNQSGFSIKRIIDVIFSIILVPIALPLILIGCLMISLTSSGKVLFIQERIGRNSKPFKIYKIRTMKCDHSGAFTTANDDRITLIGKILRLTKIDELPQLYNILIGDMSLIGPRPERPEFVEISNQENAYFDLRHVFKPGVTGWAQVNMPKATPEENLKKLEYDLYYIKNYSLKLDVEILYKTFKVVLTMNSN